MPPEGNNVNGRVLMVYRETRKVPPYAQALVACGVDTIVERARLGLTMDGFDGLVLTGGTDVAPALYGETPHPQTDPPDHARDAIECVLLAQAAARDLPVLAICRGMQLLNVYYGGTLMQHLPPEQGHRRPGCDSAHRVDAIENSLFHRVAGAGRIDVNSRHHQAVRDLGAGLVVSGRAEHDGTVEAIERPQSRFVLGVQWHPEDLAGPRGPHQALFQAFAGALRAAKPLP